MIRSCSMSRSTRFSATSSSRTSETNNDELFFLPSADEFLGRAGGAATEKSRHEDIGIQDSPQPLSPHANLPRWLCL